MRLHRNRFMLRGARPVTHRPSRRCHRGTGAGSALPTRHGATVADRQDRIPRQHLSKTNRDTRLATARVALCGRLYRMTCSLGRSARHVGHRQAQQHADHAALSVRANADRIDARGRDGDSAPFHPGARGFAPSGSPLIVGRADITASATVASASVSGMVKMRPAAPMVRTRRPKSTASWVPTSRIVPVAAQPMTCPAPQTAGDIVQRVVRQARRGNCGRDAVISPELSLICDAKTPTDRFGVTSPTRARSRSQT